MKLSSLGRYPVEETTEKPLPGADSLSCRDLARERKLRQILSPGILEERFLPMELEGREVLLKEGDEWRADNRLLQAKTQGLSFRSSKSLDKSAKLASLVLPWGTLVSANDDGDGWVKLNAVGYLRIIEACDRVLGFPHFMQMRKTLQRLGACEEAMEALKIWKLHESEPPLRYTQARTPMGRSSLRKTQTEQLQRQTVRQLIHERQGEDSTTAYFGSSRPGTAGSCRSVWTRGSSQSTCVPSNHDYNNDSADSAEEESSDSEGELCKTPKVDTTRRCCFAAANRRKTMDAVIAEMEHEPPSETKLSLIDLLCIGVGSTVGSGVFVLTGDVLPVAGPSASLSWIFAGAACLLSGFAYMELSARLPTRGSCYTFSYHGLGELWAVIGAFCITLEYGVSGAGVARNWSRKMGNFLGEDYKHVVFFYFGKGTWAANATAAELDDPYARTDHNYMDLSAAFLTAGCTLLLMGGLSLSKAVVNLMTLMKVLLVIFMVICGFLGASQNIFESGEVFAPGGISGVVNATTLLFFGFIGFDEVCCLSSKAKNASRTMPLALIGTLGIAALAISLISEPGKSSDFGTAFADKGWTVVSWIVCLGELILLPLVVLLSILPQPEVSATMATDRLIPSIFRKQSSDGTFVWGLALTGLIALVALALACPFSILWNVISLGVLLSFNLSNASLINIRYGNVGVVSQPRVAKLVFVIFVSAMGILSLALHGKMPYLASFILGAAFTLLTVYLTIHLACRYSQIHEENQEEIFHAPCVPFIPVLAIYINSTLMADIEWKDHFVLFMMLGGWLLLYLLCPCLARKKSLEV